MKVNFWTEEEDEIIRTHYSQWGAIFCIDLIDRSAGAINKRAASMGIRFVGKNLGRGAEGIHKRIRNEPVVDITNHYVEEQLVGSRRVYRMDSIRNHEVQKSHPVRNVNYGYSSCHSVLEMAA